jgi:hypothetical protein
MTGQGSFGATVPKRFPFSEKHRKNQETLENDDSRLSLPKSFVDNMLRERATRFLA